MTYPRYFIINPPAVAVCLASLLFLLLLLLFLWAVVSCCVALLIILSPPAAAAAAHDRGTKRELTLCSCALAMILVYLPFSADDPKLAFMRNYGAILCLDIKALPVLRTTLC